MSGMLLDLNLDDCTDPEGVVIRSGSFTKVYSVYINGHIVNTAESVVEFDSDGDIILDLKIHLDDLLGDVTDNELIENLARRGYVTELDQE